MSLKAIAAALGGEVTSDGISAPAPGHSKQDRSLRVFIDPADRDGFRTHSFAGDGWRVCRDYVKQQLDITDQHASSPRPRSPAAARQLTNNCDKARFFWSRRRSIEGTPAERYLREARGYRGHIPSTLAYSSPMKAEHHPALIAAYGIPDEPEPGLITIADKAVMGVQLTLLRPDGSGKADIEPNKITVGRCIGWPIVIAPMNDMLGLAITEGIEDGLSIHEATGLGCVVCRRRVSVPSPRADCAELLRLRDHRHRFQRRWPREQPQAGRASHGAGHPCRRSRRMKPRDANDVHREEGVDALREKLDRNRSAFGKGKAKAGPKPKGKTKPKPGAKTGGGSQAKLVINPANPMQSARILSGGSFLQTESAPFTVIAAGSTVTTGRALRKPKRKPSRPKYGSSSKPRAIRRADRSSRKKSTSPKSRPRCAPSASSMTSSIRLHGSRTSSRRHRENSCPSPTVCCI